MEAKRKHNIRSIRIDQEEWDRYSEKARGDHGCTPAAIIRVLLQAWEDGDIEIDMAPTVRAR